MDAHGDEGHSGAVGRNRVEVCVRQVSELGAHDARGPHMERIVVRRQTGGRRLIQGRRRVRKVLVGTDFGSITGCGLERKSVRKDSAEVRNSDDENQENRNYEREFDQGLATLAAAWRRERETDSGHDPLVPRYEDAMPIVLIRTLRSQCPRVAFGAGVHRSLGYNLVQRMSRDRWGFGGGRTR